MKKKEEGVYENLAILDVSIASISSERKKGTRREGRGREACYKT